MMRCVSWILLLGAVMMTVSANQRRVERKACDESCRCMKLLMVNDKQAMLSVSQGCADKAGVNIAIKEETFWTLEDSVKNCAIHEILKLNHQLVASDEINVTSLMTFTKQIITSKDSTDARDYVDALVSNVRKCAESVAGDTKDLDFYKCMTAGCIDALQA